MSSSDSESTRDRILAACLGLLEARASRATMAEIARAAGVSRQAVYLHFPNRAELLAEVLRRLDTGLEPASAVGAGLERLDGFIAAWGNQIPTLHGTARALMAMQDSDAEAKRAWDDRLAAVRQGCATAVAALAADGVLTRQLSEERATDLLWALLSVETWEKLISCGWSQAAYVRTMQALARKALLGEAV